jgi:hypothetical protein
MRTVFLLTGFQNWGKTYLLYKAFKKERFSHHILHKCGNRKFCVVPQSNDDLGRKGFEEKVDEILAELAKFGRKPEFIVAAFCPTRELKNNSFEIIQKKFKDDRVVLVPIEYKWCGNAKLQQEDLKEYYSGISNFHFAPLTASDETQKLEELIKILSNY